MKKIFTPSKLEIYEYDLEDVLTSSTDGGDEDPRDPNEGPLAPA